MDFNITDVKKLTYNTLLSKAPNFISLDISINSTGWVKWVDNTLTFGTFHISSKDNRKRRMEFAKFLVELYDKQKYDFIVIEDVIAGCNFKTTRGLTELNIMIEEIMDFGLVPSVPVYRLDNKEWKKQLKTLSQDEMGIKGSDDKETIRFVLNSLDFSTNEAQDVYDAMGIALAYLSYKAENKTDNTEYAMRAPKKLKEDLTKNYVITQYSDKETMLDNANAKLKRSKKLKEIVEVEYNPSFKSLILQFKQLVYDVGDDKLFCIHTPLNKIGSMFVTQGFDLTNDDVYFTAHLR